MTMLKMWIRESKSANSAPPISFKELNGESQRIV